MAEHTFHGTTVLAERRGAAVAIGGDGQVTNGAIILKATAHKIRKLKGGNVLTGFAGSTADAFSLLERFEELRQVHVIQNWCYLGSAESLDAARHLERQAPGFDSDGYKILCRPLLSGTAQIVPL